MQNEMNIEISSIILNKYFKLYLKDSMANYDINSTEAMVILMLYTNEYNENMQLKCVSNHMPCSTQDEIINELHFDKGVMTRTMKNLENKNIVIREKNKKDSRSFVFTLTEKGIEMKKIIVSVLIEWSDKVFSGIEDIEKISNALLKLTENAKAFYKGE